MIAPNSTIRLLRSDLELDNSNQLTFSNLSAQTTYFLSKAHVEVEDATYQRKDNVIRFPALIDDIITYNYVMYKNESYSNKWFYAYIESMEYLNDNMTLIKIKTDVFQTWQFDIVYKKSFVEREHVNDDTRGKHTIPENLETGEYMCDYSTEYGLGTCHVVMSTNVSPNDGTTIVGGNEYGGIYSGTAYYVFQNLTDLTNALTRIATAGNSNSINAIFYCPDWVTGYDPSGAGIQEVSTRTYQTKTFSLPLVFNSIAGDYVPKNNKLFTFPYCYYLISNNSGDSRIYYLEEFLDSGNHIAHINCYGTCCAGGSIRAIPENYKKFNSPTAALTNSNEYGINFGKYPVASYPCDAYTNWLTQNAVNFGLSAMETGVSLIQGNVQGGVMNVADTLSSVYTHQFNPVEARGNVNSGDVTYAIGKLQLSTYLMTIKKEYAKIIDDFFTMYGYKVNSLKIPNVTGRRNWNYVKTIGVNLEGAIPQDDVQELKSIFNNGVTFWHNGSNFLDYSQNNDII